MTRFSTSLLAILLLISMTQCVDEIKLDIDGAVSKVVIDGLIADSLDTYTIRLNYSSIIGVGNDNILEPITGATVKVLDDAGAVFEFAEVEAGIYTKLMQGEAGKSYHLEVQLSDGSLIESRPQMLHAAPEIGIITPVVRDETSINAAGNAVVDRRLLLNMGTSLKNLSDRPFLRWRAEGEYEFKEWYPMALNTKTCFVQHNVDLNQLWIFDTRTLAGTEIEDQPFINTELDYKFAVQYCFHIKQYAMSEAEYLYWEAIQDVTTIDGSLFDPPPGTVRGNLVNTSNPKELVAGYFSVNGVQSQRFFANPQTLNLTDIEPKCRWRFGQSPTQDCLDCTTLQNSTLERPIYWKP